ncbi:hypothetical protein ACFZCP_45245 [Streptomyces sp. NPDC007971]|uniref:hypothetical protein n=1 Tax=Streptomyces sp. NPDC007971 TaxID=3364799 RepID=UPI0036E29E59
MTAAAVARAYRALEVFVNMSQLTVSKMDLTSTAESVQQRQHWLVEQVLDWSGLPVVQVRPTRVHGEPAVPYRLLLDREGQDHQAALRPG